MTLKNFRLCQTGLFLAAAGAAVWFLRPAILFSIAMFQDTTEEMSYGWFIPAGTAYMLWNRREKLLHSRGKPSWAAWSLIILSILLFFTGARGGQDRLTQMAIVGLTVAIPWAAFGWRMAQWMILPAAYLIFAIPMGFLDTLTFHMRLFSTVLSSVVLNGCGFDVVRVGTALHSGPGSVHAFQFGVADPCSGIRSIIAIMAVTAIFGEITLNRTWKKWVLFFCSVPLAVIGNLVRLVTTAMAGSFWGQDKGIAWHDQAGFLVYLVVLLLVFALSDALRRAGPKTEKAPFTPVIPALPRFPFLSLGIIAAIPVALVAASAQIARIPPVTYETDSFMAQTLPAAVLNYTASTPFFCQNENCLFGTDSEPAEKTCPHCGAAVSADSPAELRALPKDTRIEKAIYRAPGEPSFSISAVMSGKSRLSIHRPEMCLPGQGYVLTPARVLRIDLGGGRSLKVNAMRAERAGYPPVGFVYWFFNSRGEAATHWERIFTDIWWRTVNNEINRWCMVTLRSDMTFESAAEIEKLQTFLRAWYPQVCLREKTE